MSGPILPRRERLSLTDSPRVIIFRLVEEHLRADTTLGRTVRTWKCWRGQPGDKDEISYAQAPAIRLTPRPGPVDWWTPFKYHGSLFIDVELIVQGTCIDDMDNLWYAIESSLFPASMAASPFFANLQGAGAWKLLIGQHQPPVDNRPEAGSDGGFRGMGRLSIEYRAPY